MKRGVQVVNGLVTPLSLMNYADCAGVVGCCELFTRMVDLPGVQLRMHRSSTV